MKPLRSGVARLVSRENPQEAQRVLKPDHDPYLAKATRPQEPALCPTCKAVFAEGRWTWARAPVDAFEHKCPACQRIQDRFPAGYVLIKGDFLTKNRDQIVALVKAKEESARAENPLQRIMAIDDVREGIQVTTTEGQLARAIGEALQEAFKGDLKLRYSRDENLLRATWKR
jgi:NMD protein affecting ribosome stability and mRNA decay